MRLVVGLGNPGKKYEATRHNIGFEVVELLARKHAATVPRERFEAMWQEATCGSEKLLLARPLTFMNLSGRSVRAIRDFYKMELEHILIVSDDFQLELGKLRFRATGSAGGQNGLAHVLQQLGTLDVPRLRVGIGPVPENWSTVDFVLGKYSKDERPVADEAIARAACGVEAWVAQGLATAMNRYN
jgi:PTH1 family peptidyl-tRNA hydrolase